MILVVPLGVLGGVHTTVIFVHVDRGTPDEFLNRP